MSTKVILTEQYLKDIAAAIRDKAGNSTKLKPSEMAPAIVDLPTPEGSTTITENGTHDVTSYAEAVVTVPSPPSTIEKVLKLNSAVTYSVPVAGSSFSEIDPFDIEYVNNEIYTMVPPVLEDGDIVIAAIKTATRVYVISGPSEIAFVLDPTTGDLVERLIISNVVIHN